MSTSTSTSILSAESWSNTAAFRAMLETETQTRYYRRMSASPHVQQIVDQESKRFGSVCEKIISEMFSLDPRTNTEHDATLNGKKIEIKAARYWACKDDCKWQHLEPDHDYEYALFALLDFHQFKIWVIKKSVLMGELRDQKIVTEQGGQGFWTMKSAILPHLTEITSREDLVTFLEQP